MLLEILMLIIGIVVLVKSSSFIINNSIKLAAITKISEATIGFILLAFATSLPELTIALLSGLDGKPLLSASNLFGANIANIAFIFGLICFISSFTLTKNQQNSIAHAIGITSMTSVFALAVIFVDVIFGIFCIALFYIFFRFMMDKYYVEKVETGIPTLDAVKSVFFVLCGILAVILSAEVVTKNALVLAGFVNISVIGSVILALGTTLPELSISLSAIRKRDIDLAIGNLIGSLVVNLTLIFGILAVISPFSVAPILPIILFMLVYSLIIYAMSRRGTFGLWEGTTLLSIYAFFLAWSLIYGV